LDLATQPLQVTDTDYDESIDQSTQESEENKGEEGVDKSRSREPLSQQDTEVPSPEFEEEEGFSIDLNFSQIGIGGLDKVHTTILVRLSLYMLCSLV